MPRRTHWSTAGAAVLVAVLVAVLTAPAGSAAEPSVVKGEITDHEGARLEGVEVTLLAADRALATSTSNKRGKFDLDLAEAGTYRIRFEKSGFAAHEDEIAVEAGQRLELSVQLFPEELAARQAAIEAYNAGAEAFRAGDLDEARARFEEALAHDPERVEAYLPLADVYRRQENWSAAAERAAEHLERQPDDPEAWRIALEAAVMQGDQAGTDAAVGALSGTEQGAAAAIELYNKGARASQAGDWEGALAQFEQALLLDPASLVALRGRVMAFYSLRRQDEALTAVEALLAMAPEDVEGRRLRFLIYDAVGDDAKVAEALAAYGEVAPGGAVEVMYQRAELDFDAGLVERSRDMLLEVLALAPDHPRAHYTLGRCYLSLEETARGVELLERFLELAPDDPDAAVAREMLTYFQ